MTFDKKLKSIVSAVNTLDLEKSSEYVQADDMLSTVSEYKRASWLAGGCIWETACGAQAH